MSGPVVSGCPRCGTGNEEARRFCRHCGEWLVAPSPVPAVPPDRMRARLRRGWVGERGAYTGRLSRATIAFRVLAALATVLAIATVLTLFGFHPVQRLQDQVGHARGSGRVSEVSATAEPAEPLSDRTAAWAVDGVRARGWSTAWTAAVPGEPGQACPAGETFGTGTEGGPDGSAGADGGTGGGAAQTPPSPAATATSLLVTFGGLVDVREIGIEPGLSDPAERADRWQPRTLELRWSGGGCQRVTLENTPDLQRFWVNQGEVGSVRITVVAGYRPVNPGPERLDLGEITFWQR